jgi:soluble lytic murein transglycosylase-like protein
LVAEWVTAPKAGFTFKRLKVAAITPGRRITVQIDPAEQAALLAAAPRLQTLQDLAARWGTDILRDPLMVIAAYNAGEGAVAANQGVPPYAETRDHVPKVLAAWRRGFA